MFGVLSCYIEAFSEHSDQSLFEKSRISKKDEEIKIKVLNRYNKKGLKFAEEFAEDENIAVTCDILLDLLRHRGIATLLDIQGMLDDFAKTTK